MRGRRFAARRFHVRSGADQIERCRRNLENLRRGAHAPRVLPSAPSPKESDSAALQSPTQPELFS